MSALAKKDNNLQKIPSNVRTLTGSTLLIVSLLLVLMSTVHLYQACFGVFEATLQRSLHLMFTISLTFLILSFEKEKLLKKIPWYDIILFFLGVISFGWIILNHERLIWRMPYLSPVTTIDSIMCIIVVLIVLEASRRTIGLALPILTSIFILYSFFGNYIPGLFHHEGVPLFLFVDHIYLTTEGLFSKIIGVIATYTFIFICFGAFLEVSKVGDFYVEFCNALMGKYSGGVAKTAVLSSALMGSVSGSSVANVATTGAFTIPLMKKTGFSAEEAGAIEVAASTGGQMLPPIMGAGAFIMAEFTGTPYINIIAIAFMPALIYYGMVFTAVHIMARKKGLKGLPASMLPNLWQTLKKGYHLILPIIVLVYLLIKGYTPFYAGFLSIIFLIIVTSFNKKSRFDLVKIKDSLEIAARRTIKISPACACAGIILGVSTQTGIALKISSIILSVSGGILFFAICLIAVIAYLLGMGLPTTSAYLLIAILASPALVKLGVPMLVAHMIIFWFSQTSGFTPPVCLCAYTAAAISDGDPMLTGYKSFRLSMGIILIPFLFAYSPIIFLAHNASFWSAFWISITALLGLICFNIGFEGFLTEKIKTVERLLFFACSILLYLPDYYSDMVGMVLLMVIIGINLLQKRRKDKLKLAGNNSASHK
ncbi:MAG: TRAP transporter permease [Candidatus Caldatribacteriota bacterium]|nr:TRAP transporter permease [Candidatus Caldatribacteriota bacterium]